MSTSRTLAVAAVAVLLAMDTPPGCAAPDSQPKGPPTCVMKVSREPDVYRRTSAADVEIRGSVAVYCTPSPRRHLFTVWLTHEFPAGSDVWLPRGAEARSSRLPDAHGFDLTATLHGCISGRWRMQARARGTAADGSPFGPVDLPPEQSPARSIECPGPKG